MYLCLEGHIYSFFVQYPYALDVVRVHLELAIFATNVALMSPALMYVVSLAWLSISRKCPAQMPNSTFSIRVSDSILNFERLQRPSPVARCCFNVPIAVLALSFRSVIDPRIGLM